jgi:HSP90 family molecular chaperone
MIITAATSAVNTSNFTGTSFTVSASAHAFKVLSRSLYTNKEEAVLRELYANGYDANLTTGKAPVRICLPTALEPNLVVSDTGCGMNELELLTLYSTYFDSTKRESVENIGGFGLTCN